jgi:hypothetical protein
LAGVPPKPRIATRRLLLLLMVAVIVPGAARAASSPAADASATCADYPNQAAAQRAADTRDADGDASARTSRARA